MSRVSDVLEAALTIAHGNDRAELIALASALTTATQTAVASLLAATVASAQSEAHEDDTRVLTIPQAAKRLGLPLYSVREMTRQGELAPVIRRGRRVLVSVGTLRKFVSASETATPGALRRVR